MNPADEYAWARRTTSLAPPLREMGRALGWPDTPPSNLPPKILPVWKRAAGTWAEAVRRSILAMHDGKTTLAGEWLDFAARVEKDWYDGRDGMTRDVAAELAKRTGITLATPSRSYIPVQR